MKKHDRECPPCPKCGAALYEKFWGNGGWVKMERVTDDTHGDDRCVTRLRAALLTLADASEAFVSSDSDMPSHGATEHAYDTALVAARLVLG